ncbi:MAG: hypothetical protein DWQ36_09915 [Acidobacteria bacterium]|nr:MAG: hypothetical protein DWQ30_01195 [Acidobacteriota bacterium]REK08373.1 MAG: hypothetical protein DWQ36_09915 [Acidobacteriota bacterium]
MAPPRAVFVDYPLGHTSGKPDDPADQDAILEAALRLLEAAVAPGTIVDLDLRWAEDDSWKLPLLAPEPDDERSERHPEPQYQNEEDRRAAETAVGCAGCVELE